MATSKSASDKKSDKKSDADVDEHEVDATAETVESRAVESEPSPSTPHHNFFTRLYTGTGAFEVIGRRKLWFTVSAVIIAIAVTSIVIRGFTLGIDFEGGTKVSFNRGNATVKQVEDVFRKAVGHDAEQVVIVGNGGSATVQNRAESLTNEQSANLKEAL